MKNPKHNFTIIPNWLVDELSGAELKLYCKMYNGWCLMKDADGWYYRSLSKLKEDLGITCKNRDKLVDRVKKFEELGILAVERCDRKTNRYKFNEDFMFSHEEDTTNDASTPEGYITNEGSTPEGYMLVPQKGTSLVPQRGTCLVPQKGTLYNTKIKDKKENTVLYNTCTKEKEINKEKESGVSGQGLLSEEGFSDFNLTNEGNNFIQSESEQDRQGDKGTVTPTSKSDKEKNKLNTFNDKKDSQNTGLHSNLHQAIAPFRGESDSEPPQSSARPPLTDTPKRSYGDVYWKVRKMIEKGKGFSEQKVRDYVNEHFIITGEVPQHEFERDLSELQRLKESLEEKKGYTTEGDLVRALTSEPFVPYGVTAEA